jgi:ferrous iron transport protein B
MRFVLVGQPNSGKSTIFNSVAGYRSATANFPGSSTSYTHSRALIHGRKVDIVDLPGIYSLGSSHHDPGVALTYLLDEDYDLIINVVDASRLGRSLELTLQLLELGRPVIMALNMMDEARHRGIEVDAEALAVQIGVPVIETDGRRGRGLRELFRGALRTAHAGEAGMTPRYDREVESAIARVTDLLQERGEEHGIPVRLQAIKLLERDPYMEARVLQPVAGLAPPVHAIVADLQNVHGWSGDQVVSGMRHAVAHAVEDRVTTLQAPDVGWREHVNRFMLHPVTGGPLMLVILGGFFFLVYTVGQRFEAPLVAAFEALAVILDQRFPTETLVGTLISGVVMGISGGVAIVLPYLLPFLLGLAVLEDSGYLPRIAYILDSFMHRIGLHGKSILPMILGYGCSVPAIMSTRILESSRDRRLTVVLAAFIPCSARTVVIYGLVAAYMGPLWALAVYLLNIVVVVVLGNVLARAMKGDSPGLILEIPDLRLPSVKTLLIKTWLSLKEFITIAWPLLIVSSAVLGLLEWLQADGFINAIYAPLTVTLLGLPAAVGMSLVFGIMRKELTLVMLVQALGTTDIGSALTTSQMMTYTLFVVFYVPCMATIAAMAREVGWKDTAWITVLTFTLASAIGFASRVVFYLAGA